MPDKINIIFEWIFDLLGVNELINPVYSTSLRVSLAILITAILAMICNHLFINIEKKFRYTKSTWDNAIINAIRPPVRMLIWIIGINVALNLSSQKMLQIGDHVFATGVALFIAWFLLRLVKAVEQNIILHKKDDGTLIDRTAVDAIGNILKITIIVSTFITILSLLGISVTGLLAFSGVGGIAVGFAAKDLLANFFGTLIILFDRPFNVGDWIKSTEKNFEGTVEKIGWRQTVLRNFDRRPFYIPNALFSTIIIENPSRMSHRRIDMTIGIRYDDFNKIEKIIGEVNKMMIKHKDVDNKQDPMVHFRQFSTSSIDFNVRCFTDNTDLSSYREIIQDISLKIGKIIEKQGAEIAFPTSTIYLQEATTKKSAKKKK